ncbi:peptidylprolyl isomerase [Pacificimonas sp. WHA3]|uniref:Peptidylprolyl isomerase n=1 Tax=Pacificimonas pallii TaxID=2827236 RepID=A0ABS6SGB3_9SPHN|nr:peptidylprolyl isomerase [Pacificimonas pallii]MBV7256877.1 peptidylprolyl isomerase [Pacificimonas pallii]
MLSIIAAGMLMMTPPPPAPLSSAQILAHEDTIWLRPHPENTIYMDMPTGRVIISLGQEIAPLNRERVKELVRAGAFNGAAIDRVQENYVVQWSAREADGVEDIVGEVEGDRGAVGSPRLLPFGDTYAPQVGFIGPLPAAQDGKHVWLAHCYAMVGVGRGYGLDSGNGAELYVVVGQAPRHLDRNITLVGKVLMGMEHLTSLPRGDGELGFYTEDQEKAGIVRVTVAADLPEDERSHIEYMSTSGTMWDRWLEVRANRVNDGWFTHSHGAVDLCNIPVPVREVSGKE